MQVKDFLREENVFYGLGAASKDQLLRQLAEKLAARTTLPASTLAKALLDRERLGSTGIGNGVAIPHAMVEGLVAPICLAAKLGRPVDFEAVDEVPIDLIVLVLTPAGQASDALNILSCFARRFREEEVVTRLRLARSAEEIYVILTD